MLFRVSTNGQPSRVVRFFLSSSGFRTAERDTAVSTYKENEDEIENENNAQEVQDEKPERIKSRTREIDYMRVEDTLHGQALTHFELKVKEKIACVPSAYDQIARQEEEEERAAEIRRKIEDLLKKARLTASQEACYRMVYVEMLSDSEIAERLSLGIRNVAKLKQSVLEALKRVHERQCIKNLADQHDLTEKQRLVISLRYEEQLSRKEIADRLGVTIRAVDDLLVRMRKLILKENSPKSVGP